MSCNTGERWQRLLQFASRQTQEWKRNEHGIDALSSKRSSKQICGSTNTIINLTISAKKLSGWAFSSFVWDHQIKIYAKSTRAWCFTDIRNRSALPCKEKESRAYGYDTNIKLCLSPLDIASCAPNHLLQSVAPCDHYAITLTRSNWPLQVVLRAWFFFD